MAEILLSKYAVAACELLAIAVLLFILIRQAGERKAARERREVRRRKKRNADLDRMLKNPEIKREEAGEPAPFEVKYREGMTSISSPLPGFQLEVEVHTQTSARRYLFDLEREVTIGRDKDNVLPIEDPLLAGKCCTIFLKNRSVYIRNRSKARPLTVERGSKKQPVTNRLVKLMSRDVVRAGSTAIHISIYEN